jgi:F-type H+-transporting ATPase subunit b
MEILRDPEFWVTIAFIILVIAVWKPIWRAMVGGLDGRAERIRTELDEARRLREEAQGLLAEYQQKQRAALEEARGILAQAAKDAESGRRQAAEDLEASLKRREQQAIERIAQAEAKAVDEVRSLAVELAVATTRRLLRDNLDAARAARLVDQAIAELPQKLH